MIAPPPFSGRAQTETGSPFQPPAAADQDEERVLALGDHGAADEEDVALAGADAARRRSRRR